MQTQTQATKEHSMLIRQHALISYSCRYCRKAAILFTSEIGFGSGIDSHSSFYPALPMIFFIGIVQPV